MLPYAAFGNNLTNLLDQHRKGIILIIRCKLHRAIQLLGRFRILSQLLQILLDEFSGNIDQLLRVAIRPFNK